MIFEQHYIFCEIENYSVFLPRAPVIRETVPAAPPTTPENTERTPMTNPSANSLGPSTAPKIGKKNQFDEKNIKKNKYYLEMVHKTNLRHFE